MTLSIINTELDDILNSIKILSSTDFTYHDKLYRNIGKDRQNIDLIETDDNKQYIELSLEDLLYRAHHCRNISSVERKGSHRSEKNDIKDFTGELSKANTGTGTWEGGWEINRIEKDGQLAVKKNGLILWVNPKHFILTADTFTEVQVGSRGKIRMSREFRRLLPGFYMANSNAPFDHEKKDITVRIYWNIKKENAALLMETLTFELNNKQIPFRFKILSNPKHYPRADSGVLYIHKQYFNMSKTDIFNIYFRVKDFLNPLTPLFAKKLANGLSLAEDPNNGESFGQHRSRILAQAIKMIYKEKLSLSQQLVGEVANYFKKNGIDLTRPYLNTNSIDDYETLFPI